MPRAKRRPARIDGAQRARDANARAGREVKASRRRRRWTQALLGEKIGVSRAYIAKLEAGQATGAPLEIWFALGEALGRPFRAEFLRDRLEELADAGHLAMQELVLRLAQPAGYRGGSGSPRGQRSQPTPSTFRSSTDATDA